jgi:NAD(P)-dependent dehydrogenase (short-subunit alcohol dehydrogenase family)
MSKPLADRIALVTGASRGIGAASALALAKAGAHVVALARTVKGLEVLDDAIRQVDGSTTLVPLDLHDLPALDRLGAALNARYQRLDIFVGNAGVLGPLSPVGHVDPKAWDEVLTINVTANFRLVRSLDPLLRRSDAGRVVFITSAIAAMSRAYWAPYAVSKVALEALARTYASEMCTTPVRVNLLDPGPIRTRMRFQAMPGADPMSLETPQAVADKVVELCLPGFVETGKLYDYRTQSLLTFATPWVAAP